MKTRVYIFYNFGWYKRERENRLKGLGVATSGSIGDRRLDERTVVGGISNGTQVDASQGHLYVRGETGQFYTRYGIRQHFQPKAIERRQQQQLTLV